MKTGLALMATMAAASIGVGGGATIRNTDSNRPRIGPLGLPTAQKHTPGRFAATRGWRKEQSVRRHKEIMRRQRRNA